MAVGRDKIIHPVEAATLSRAGRVTCVELVRDANIQVTLVLVVRAVFDRATNSLLLLNGENIAQVEDSLLPVGVLGVGASGEVNGLVASAKLDIEPGDKGVDEVGALGSELIGHLEGEVGCGNSVEIECDDGAWVSHKRLHLDGVNEGLVESNLLHRAVVESVDVVPDYS